MLELVFTTTFLFIAGLLVLLGFAIWAFRDVIGYLFEIIGYTLQSAVKVVIQGAVAVIELADDLMWDLDIADEPMLRLALLGAVGFVLGVVAILLLGMIKGQPWVIITMVIAVTLGCVLGLVADPDKDWSLGSFPSFPRGGGGGDGPHLPLNL